MTILEEKKVHLVAFEVKRRCLDMVGSIRGESTNKWQESNSILRKDEEIDEGKNSTPKL